MWASRSLTDIFEFRPKEGPNWETLVVTSQLIMQRVISVYHSLSDGSSDISGTKS